MYNRRDILLGTIGGLALGTGVGIAGGEFIRGSDDTPANTETTWINKTPNSSVEAQGDDGVDRPGSSGQGNTIKIETGAERETVLAALSSPGVVVFEPGEHLIHDVLEIRADDLTVRVKPEARLKLSSDADPKTFVGSKGAESSMLFHAANQRNLRFVNNGIIDHNNRNRSLHSNGILFENVTNSVIKAPDGEFRDNNVPIALTDCERIYTRSIHVPNVVDNGSAINPEGCRHCIFEDTYCKAGQEAIDFNARNKHCVIIDVVGEDVHDQVVDLNESPNTTIIGLEARGDCHNVLNISGGSGHRRTNKPPIRHSNDVTVRGIVGESEKPAINTTGMIQNLTITGMDVTSKKEPAVVLGSKENRFLNGFSLTGRAKSQADGVPTLSIGRATQ